MTASIAARLDDGTRTIIPLARETSTQVSWRVNVALDEIDSLRNIGFAEGPWLHVSAIAIDSCSDIASSSAMPNR